ncbi:hypothetical protein [Amycolatopsis sp.]|uniref:hypothetical protein n=1 Tax=Amycolatopsis sp. TaxID=37632 RepID=UPI002BB93B5D|nr:hypothetical protein [Amycolatopsis sp.]HVV10153.1 hypothetical protein [Amycolatopsis sp.]
MKRSAAANAVLGAVAMGAAIMLVVSVSRDSGAVTTASVAVAAPAPSTASPSTTLATQSTHTPTPSPTPAISAEQGRAIAEAVQAAARKTVSSAKVGLEVYDRQTDAVVTSANTETQFSSMSVVKLLIAIDILARDDWALPSESTQQRITRMLSMSDDAIASSFWVSDGGQSIITRDVKLMGLTDTTAPRTAGEWGDTKITAADMVTVYRYLEDKVPQPAHDLLYNAMFHASSTGADGTNQYFGIPNGLPGTTWAIKQGWGSSGSTAYYNTTGLVGKDARYVVIVLSSGSLGSYSSMPKALTNATAQLAPIFAA